MLIEKFDKRRVSGRDLGAEDGLVGGGKPELHLKAKTVAVKGNDAIKVIRDEAEMGEAADHKGDGQALRHDDQGDATQGCWALFASL